MSSIEVAIRLKPLDSNKKSCVHLNNAVATELIVKKQDKEKSFNFDYIYDSKAEQAEIFNDLGLKILKYAFQGYNACLFAYGQTGSGKTFTMTGTEEQPGIIPRLAQALFQNDASFEIEKVEVSFYEIYNEKVQDLSTPSSGCKVREHPVLGPYVEGLKRFQVTNATEIESLMNLGNSNRSTEATKLNDKSSRSHSIFTIDLLIRLQGEQECRTSRVNLVDLAGSERIKTSQTSGERLREGVNINKSLTTLALVINNLVSKKPFVPFRDSTLTWLLKENLGGNSKTIMLATISQQEEYFEETLNTLRYAQISKKILTRAVVNQDPNLILIRDLKKEIESLKEDLKFSQDSQQFTLFKDLLTRSEKSLSFDSNQREIKRLRNAALNEKDTPCLVNLHEELDLMPVYLPSFESSKLTIGSDPLNDLVIKDSNSISSFHAEILFENSKFYLNPKEGICYKDNVMIFTNTLIEHGDFIQFGSYHLFRFSCPKMNNSREISDEKVQVLQDSGENLESVPDLPFRSFSVHESLSSNVDISSKKPLFKEALSEPSQVFESSSLADSRTLIESNRVLESKMSVLYEKFRSATNNGVRIVIPRVIQQESDNPPFFLYQIQISVFEQEWQVERRFNEFKQFHHQYKSKLPQSISSLFPSSWQWPLSRPNIEIAEKRRLLLQTYLNALIGWMSSNPNSIVSRLDFSKQDFLEEVPFFNPLKK